MRIINKKSNVPDYKRLKIQKALKFTDSQMEQISDANLFRLYSALIKMKKEQINLNREKQRNKWKMFV